MKHVLIRLLGLLSKHRKTITLADHARDARRWSRAAALYRKALRRDRNRADIWIQYGHMLKEMGRLQNAEKAYRTAVSLQPTNIDAYLQLAYFLERLERLEEANDLFAIVSALQQRPTNEVSKTVTAVEESSLYSGDDAETLHAVSAMFDEHFYLRVNPDVATAGFNALEHFLRFGARERRDPSKRFRTANYVRLYPESLKHPKGPFFEFLALPAEQQQQRLRKMQPLPLFRRYPVANGLFLVVHEAERTGAPLIASNLLHTLACEFQIPVVTVLLNSSGPLKSEFIRESVEVIEYDALLQSFGNDPHSTWDDIARRLVNRRITHGICNTVLAGQAIETLSAYGFACLALVHELTDSILGYGWQRYAECIAMQARTVVFPAAVVRDRFIRQFGPPRGQVRVVGQPPNLRASDLCPTDGPDIRRRLRIELRLEENDFLVLSVGTGDFRKGIDLFLQTAKAALERSEGKERKLYFAWLGQMPRDPILWIGKDLGNLGYADRVFFLGEQFSDVAQYYVAADIFFLPSREDPFPTVVIEALHAGLPIVGFAGSGGVAEQVTDAAGVILPYGDWSAAADALVKMSEADLTKNRAAARARAHDFNTAEEYAADLLTLLQFGITRDERRKDRPRTELVGVGIPTYECGPYIEERLWSVFEQTLVPAEVFIVDDCSTDATVQVVARLKQLAPCAIRVVENSENSGSVFRQWQRCFEELEREFIWIAESDDSARLCFLSSLVPWITNQMNVNMVYANTATVDVYSKEDPAGHNEYLRSVAPVARWESSYERLGLQEISEVLAFANTILNVSGCLIRREAAVRAIEGVTRYRIAGDWLFYLNLLQTGSIAYSHQRLNLHRRHTTSIVTRLEPEPIFHIERAGAHLRALSIAKLGPTDAERMIELQDKEFQRLVTSKSGVGRSYLDLMQRVIRDTAVLAGTLAKQRVLVILPDLHVGGGQMAGIRMANALAEKHYVWVYVVDHSPGDGDLASRLDPRLGVLPYGDFQQLLSFLEAADIELIHSHVWWSDKLAYRLKRERPETRWVITMHGCYERILKEQYIDPFFFPNVVELLSATDGIAYLADKNLEVFDHFGLPFDSRRMRKIYNGVDLPEEISALVDAKQAKTGAHSFVMVGRGIEEKGWREAAEALQQVNSWLTTEGRPLVYLTLVGSGEFLTKMQQEPEFADLPICYVGAVDDVFPILLKSDVGLLPSFFPQESLPTVVAEYLLCRVPAIVTEIGEAPVMLESGAGAAGIVIGFSNGRADVAALASAMYAYVTKPELFAEHQRRTSIAAKRFSVEYMLREYSELAGVDLFGSELTGESRERPGGASRF
jgi:glycosyltransferase involved in cell wall biosynthesis